MIKIYANSANYPYANIVGQEFFQTGLIPGETDFRIFRDYGNIPGMITNHLNFNWKIMVVINSKKGATEHKHKVCIASVVELASISSSKSQVSCVH